MKLRWNNKYSELFIDTLSTAIFTVSFGTAFFIVRGLEITIWQIGLIALLQSIIVLMFSRNWYLVPILLSGSAISGLIILWQAEMIDQFASSAAQFFLHIGFFLRTGDTAGQNEFVIAATLLLPLTCLIFLFIRKVTWLAVYVFLVAVIFIPLLIWFTGIFTAFLFALAGLLIQLPRHFSHTLEKIRPHDTQLPRGPMQMLAIPVVIISILMANTIVPDNTGDWRWAPLVNRITDIQDLWYNSLGAARSWQAFSLADYGFIPSGYRLGGPVTLSDRPILRVESEHNVLIRGVSSSIYTGYSWVRPQRQHYRFDSSLWRFIRQRAFNLNLPAAAEGREFRQRFGQEITVSIVPLINSSTIFSGGRVNDIDLDDKLNYPPYFTESADLFVFNALPRQTNYTIRSLLYDRNQEEFDSALMSLEQNISRTDREWQQIQEEYLQLPSELPTVAQTAQTVTSAGDTPYARAVLLENFLLDEFTYSLSPEMPPEDDDFVAHFLENRVGYCVYFATAMVVMARTLGIPARYVEGFTLEPATSENSWLATGENAHSWAELYFYGIGWLTFDPTPATLPQPDDPPINGDITPPPEPSPEPTPALPPHEPDLPEEETSILWLIILISLAVILIMIRLGIMLARHRHNQRFLPEYVKNRFADPTNRLDFYYRDVLRQLACIDVIPEPGETMKNFAMRADKYLRFTDHSVPQAFESVSSWVYGDIAPNEDDINRLMRLHIRLEERLHVSLSKTMYFWKRVLR